MTTNDEIDLAVAALSDLLKIGTVAYPPLAIAAPAISMFIKFEAHKLKSGITDGSIISDGHGGLITKEWAEDPRHQLNADGSFKS